MSTSDDGASKADNNVTAGKQTTSTPASLWQRVWVNQRKSRVAGILLIAVLIFQAGIMVGDGRITVYHHGQSSQLPSDLDYTSVNRVYRALKNNYDGKLSQNQLLDGLKSGLAEATGDPYTEYFNPSAAKQFQNQLSGTFSGVGAQLGLDSDNNIEVIAPINGSPADKAGLKARDIISAINNTSTAGMSIDQAVNAIRGPKGTQVTLKVIRDKAQQLSIVITRDDISVPSVTSKMLDNNIGYIQINQFSDDTAGLATKAAKDFQQQHVKGVILDLRGDPGGLLDAAVSVSSLWLPTGTKILDEKQGSKVVQTYTANGPDVLHGIPTEVLIDGGSASAAEITAGALKDNGAAGLVGEKSYGKGSVQQIIDFNDGGMLKVTIARWYRPNGQNIDKVGITPDKKAALTADDVKNGNDPQQALALSLLQGQ